MSLRNGHRLWVGLGIVAASTVFASNAQAQAQTIDWTAIENESVAMLQDYLRIDTTNPPGNETLGAEFFAKHFADNGIESQIVESAPGRGNIIARLRGDGSKQAVVLMHHMDVVPADARFWTADPFGGEIRDGELYGRGAIDTKGMGVANALALLTLKRSGIQLAGDVIFLGVADEEAGGKMGAGYVVKTHPEWFEGTSVVLNEGGYIASDADGKIVFYGVEAAQKIPFWVRLVAQGAPGHGSMPRPDSASNRLVRALGRVIAYETPLRVVREVQQFYADTAHLAPSELQPALADLRASLADPAFAKTFTSDIRQNALVRNTISLTALRGSNKTNVIPAEASAELDIRLLPDQDPVAFLEELKRVINDDTIQVETLLSFPAATSPLDHELFDVLREFAKRDAPDAVVTTPLLGGFTDCHYFREHDIPCYGFWPFALNDQSFGVVHGNDERIGVDVLKAGTRTMIELVAKLAGATLPNHAPSP
ncbi:MAG: M20/M25/M40 family metallo-hydrolase [Myxococcota bacterium]|nr:M20/M25/M40 family metallo-hydrolase [Myxococcota bacterium]